MIPWECAVGVERELMALVVRVESSGNPYNIGVVDAKLAWPPKNLGEAIATVQDLEAKGYNYSIGISQVNRVHFKRFGWQSDIRLGFDMCENLKRGARILQDCYRDALKAGYKENGPVTEWTAVHSALSCYWSGSLTAGGKYVQMVLGPSAPAKPAPGKTSEGTKKIASPMYQP